MVQLLQRRTVKEATMDNAPVENGAVDRPIRKRELQGLTGLSDTTIWRLERAGAFPRRFSLHGRIVAWRRSEVMRWIDEKMNPSAAA